MGRETWKLDSSAKALRRKRQAWENTGWQDGRSGGYLIVNGQAKRATTTASEWEPCPSSSREPWWKTIVYQCIGQAAFSGERLKSWVTDPPGVLIEGGRLVRKRSLWLGGGLPTPFKPTPTRLLNDCAARDRPLGKKTSVSEEYTERRINERWMKGPILT